MARRIREAEDALERTIAIENVSYYANSVESTADEVTFLVDLLERADAKLLLDVNNVYVNSRNHGFDPCAYIDQIPRERVVQLHVAGHFIRDDGQRIDTHAEPVCDDVYDLLEYTLAQEVTRIVHGEELLNKAEQASQVLFGAELTDLSVADIRDIFDEVPSADVPRSALEGEGLGVLDLLADSGLTSSKGEARRLIRGGGIYLNNRRLEDERQQITLSDSIGGQLIVLRRGGKTYRLVQLVG
jgi:tyrosyl-tRNA synthetase